MNSTKSIKLGLLQLIIVALYLLFAIHLAMIGLGHPPSTLTEASILKYAFSTKLFLLIGPASNLLYCSYPPDIQISMINISRSAIVMTGIEIGIFMVFLNVAIFSSRLPVKAIALILALLCWAGSAYLAVELLRV